MSNWEQSLRHLPPQISRRRYGWSLHQLATLFHVSHTSSASGNMALHPLRAAICIKAKLREPARLEKQLKVAEQNRQIFTCQTGKGDRLILEFLPNDDTPHLEHIYLNDMGRITNGQFEGWRLSHKDSTLQSQKETFRVITQVRQTYANRFLRAAGEHLSRIALSFVRYKPASGAAETSVTSTRESSGQPGQETHSRPAGEDQASVSAQIPSRPP